MVELPSENVVEVYGEPDLVFEDQAIKDNLFIYTLFHSKLVVTTCDTQLDS